MFEFLNERLINSATDAFSGRPKFEKLDSHTFRIYRFGTFDANCIIGRTVYKTKSSQPVKPSIEITVPASIIPSSGEIKNIRLNIDLRRSGSVNSEYSTYNSRIKAKPMIVNLEINSNDIDNVKMCRDFRIERDLCYIVNSLDGETKESILEDFMKLF